MRNHPNASGRTALNISWGSCFRHENPKKTFSSEITARKGALSIKERSVSERHRRIWNLFQPRLLKLVIISELLPTGSIARVSNSWSGTPKRVTTWRKECLTKRCKHLRTQNRRQCRIFFWWCSCKKWMHLSSSTRHSSGTMRMDFRVLQNWSWSFLQCTKWYYGYSWLFRSYADLQGSNLHEAFCNKLWKSLTITAHKKARITTILLTWTFWRCSLSWSVKKCQRHFCEGSPFNHVV